MGSTDKSRLLLFGGGGKLGKEIIAQVGLDAELLAPRSSECDITDPAQVQKVFDAFKPDAVINAAALVGNRECEEQKEKAWAINVAGAANVAKACRDNAVKLVFISSAAIFDGLKGEYTEEDAPTPTYYYAVTKVAAEQAVAMLPDHVIVRLDLFPRTGFKYPNVLTDHYTSKIPMDEAAAKILRLAWSDFSGIINIGQPRASVYDILKPYYPDIKPIKMADSAMPNFPKDISLDMSKWQRNFGD